MSGAVRSLHTVLVRARAILGQFQTARRASEFGKAVIDWDGWRQRAIVARAKEVADRVVVHAHDIVGRGTESAGLRELLQEQKAGDNFGGVFRGLKELGEHTNARTQEVAEGLFRELLYYGPGMATTAADFEKRHGEPSAINKHLRTLDAIIEKIEDILPAAPLAPGTPEAKGKNGPGSTLGTVGRPPKPYTEAERMAVSLRQQNPSLGMKGIFAIVQKDHPQVTVKVIKAVFNREDQRKGRSDKAKPKQAKPAAKSDKSKR